MTRAMLFQGKFQIWSGTRLMIDRVLAVMIASHLPSDLLTFYLVSIRSSCFDSGALPYMLGRINLGLMLKSRFVSG